MAQKDILTSGIEMSDVIACTGFPVPESMEGKTFAECTSVSADIEANKEETIDVSSYTAPVEITPSEGKDGMAKVTVTLSNIPTGGSMSQTKPAWTNLSGSDIAVSSDVVVPDGVKMYYYHGDAEATGVLTGDGVKTVGAFTVGAFAISECSFIASCGDDIAVYLSGSQG